MGVHTTIKTVGPVDRFLVRRTMQSQNISPPPLQSDHGAIPGAPKHKFIFHPAIITLMFGVFDNFFLPPEAQTGIHGRFGGPPQIEPWGSLQDGGEAPTKILGAVEGEGGARMRPLGGAIVQEALR